LVDAGKAEHRTNSPPITTADFLNHNFLGSPRGEAAGASRGKVQADDLK
jgi:hypothetical protein